LGGYEYDALNERCRCIRRRFGKKSVREVVSTKVEWGDASFSTKSRYWGGLKSRSGLTIAKYVLFCISFFLLFIPLRCLCFSSAVSLLFLCFSVLLLDLFPLRLCLSVFLFISIYLFINSIYVFAFGIFLPK